MHTFLLQVSANITNKSPHNFVNIPHHNAVCLGYIQCLHEKQQHCAKLGFSLLSDFWIKEFWFQWIVGLYMNLH